MPPPDSQPPTVTTRDRAKGRDLRRLSRLWPFVRPYRWQVAGAIVAATIAASTVLALGRGIAALIDQGFGKGNSDLLDNALAAIIGGTMILAAATYVRVAVVSWLGERVVADIRRAVYDHVIGLSPGFFELTRTGEVLSRITTDTTLLQTLVGSSASVALRNLLLFTGGTIMMVVTSPRLTGLALLVVPLVVLPIILFGRRVRRLSRATQDRVADVSAYADETLQAVRTVQAFTHEAIDRRAFAQRIESTVATAMSYVRARAFLVAIVMLLVFGAIAVVLWLGGHDVLARRLSGGDLAAFIIYAAFAAGAVGALAEVAGDVQRAAGAIERLVELLETQPDIAAPPSPAPLPEPARGAVRFEEVSSTIPRGPSGRRSTVSIWRWSRASGWRSSVPPAPARPRCSNCCCASTIRRPAPSPSTASICARRRRRPCARASVWSRRSRQCSPATPGTTSAMGVPTRPTPRCAPPPTPPTPATSSTVCPRASAPISASAACGSPAASASASRSPARCCAIPPCCCSTRPPARSTPKASGSCSRRSTS